MMSACTTSVMVDATILLMMIDTLVTGVASIFDRIPISMSVSMAMPDHAAPNMTVITTTPGVKNWR